MIERCHKPSHVAYARYGGRGITVCDRWRESFEAFLDDMGVRPSLDHSLDRIDNDRGYEPGNCRWATRRQQVDNSTAPHLLEHNGETLCVTEWARRLGVSRQAILQRLRMGWSVEESLTTVGRRLPKARRGEAAHGSKLTAEQVRAIRAAHRAGGVTQSELAARFGVSQGTVQLILAGKTWRHVA